MEFEKITSAQNPRIKSLVRLIEKSTERRDQNLFVIEGTRETGFAFRAGFTIQSIFWCPEIMPLEKLENYLKDWGLSSALVTEINNLVFEKIAYRENSQGIVSLAESRKNSLDSIKLRENPLVIVLESVEKPGNLGAILRTADAAAVDAVLVCDPRSDLFNPNTIRSSLGCIFTVQIAACTTEEAISWLQMKNIQSFAASLKGDKIYSQTDFTGPSAIVMGTESEGLSEKWHQASSALVKIPMNGAVDSLNVSTSAAILVFEAKRQRGQ